MREFQNKKVRMTKISRNVVHRRPIAQFPGASPVRDSLGTGIARCYCDGIPRFCRYRHTHLGPSLLLHHQVQSEKGFSCKMKNLTICNPSKRQGQVLSRRSLHRPRGAQQFCGAQSEGNIRIQELETHASGRT